MQTSTIQNAALKTAWENLKLSEPTLRIRDTAKKLGISEAELLATGIGENVIRLTNDFVDQVKKLPTLGRVMALCRNEGCVLEHKGTFQKIHMHAAGSSAIAIVIGPIEQRLFFHSWKFGFAVSNESAHGPQFSLQYFDKSGEAILKIFLQTAADFDASEKLVLAHTAQIQSGDLEIETFDSPEYVSRENLDSVTFQKEWEEMKDTHDFFGMLQKHKLNRLDAVKWIDDKWAHEVDRLSVRKVLEVAAETKLPIMIFAGNKGAIQIHQGPIRTIRPMNQWLNIMDPDFNMHLNEDCIASAYLVHKNTDDGLVSALELFDAKGEMIAQFFGLRKPGIPQKPEWKALLESLNH